MLPSAILALSLALSAACVLGWRTARILWRRVDELKRSILVVDRRVDRCGGAIEVEVRRLDKVEEELAEHLRDPIRALSKPPRLHG